MSTNHGPPLGNEATFSQWQAIGLPLAVVTAGLTNGAGTLAAAAVLAALTWSLARLRTKAPGARSTGDLVGAVLGDRAATLTVLLQLAAYVFLAAELARIIGFNILARAGLATSWLCPLWSVNAVGLAALAAYALTARALALICTVLAGVAVLIVSGLSLAIIAKALTGAEPMPFGAQPPTSGLPAVTTVLLLGMSLAGVEVITAANRTTRSVAHPMGWALAIGAACAALVWTAAQIGATRGFRYDATQFPVIAVDFFGRTASNWLLAAVLCAAGAGLLAIMWALTHVTDRAIERLTSKAACDGPAPLALPMITVLTVAVICFNWVCTAHITMTIPAVLLMTVYVVVAVASSRLTGWKVLTRATWIVFGAVLAAAIVLPALHYSFAPFILCGVAITALIVTLAAGIAIVSARASSTPPSAQPTPLAPADVSASLYSRRP